MIILTSSPPNIAFLKFQIFSSMTVWVVHSASSKTDEGWAKSDRKGWGWFYRDFRGLQELVGICLSSTPRGIERHTTLKGMPLRKKKANSSGSYFGWKWEAQELSKQICWHRGHRMGVIGASHDGNLIPLRFHPTSDLAVSQRSDRPTSELRLEVNNFLFGKV